MIEILAPGIRYDSDTKGYIMLDVGRVIPELRSTEKNGVKLLPKAEFHCSIVAARDLSDGNPELEALIVETTKASLHRVPIKVTGLSGAYYICKETKDGDATQTTVIGGLETSSLDDLHKSLQKIVPTYQPFIPHVTLLKSQNSKYGIGVNSQTDLEKLCRRDNQLATQIVKHK